MRAAAIYNSRQTGPGQACGHWLPLAGAALAWLGHGAGAYAAQPARHGCADCHCWAAVAVAVALMPALLLAALMGEATAQPEGLVGYTEYAGLNCYANHGGVVIDHGPRGGAVYTIPQCEAHCDATPNCFCTVMTSNATATAPGLCWRRATCEPELCGKNHKYNAFMKPGAPPPPPVPSLGNCSKAAGGVSSGCIFDQRHNFRATSCSGDVAECCALCAAEPSCTAWTHSSGFGTSACMLYNGSGTTGQLRSGPSKCTSGGSLPPPPPAHPPPARPPPAGAPCKDCPNILLMFTDVRLPSSPSLLSLALNGLFGCQHSESAGDPLRIRTSCSGGGMASAGRGP